jgi:Lantibiotic dehydratase, N terminus
MFLMILDSDGLTRSLPLPVLTRSNVIPTFEAKPLSNTMYDQAFFTASWASSKNAPDHASTISISAVAVSEPQCAALPAHLIRLNSDWALWRCVALRGAGFPANSVLPLTAPECALAADNLLAAEKDAQLEREAALDVFRESLDTLRSEGRWDTDKERRNSLLNDLRLLKSDKLPKPTESRQKAVVETLRAAMARVEELKTEFHKTFKTSSAQISEAMREVANKKLFREAITWQNRTAFHGGVERLGMSPTFGGEGKRRKHEAVVASYLQRYCVKNDTIGFFGPVGWARINEEKPGLHLTTPSQLVSTRNVYFEGWAIDALTNTLNKNASLRRWCAPRRLPFIFLDGDTLRIPMRRPLRLAARHAAVLRQCNGDLTAHQIAQSLLCSRVEGMSNEREIYAILEGLLTQKLIVWQWELPVDVFPERRLRELLERIEDKPLREATLSSLKELEHARDAVSAAAGDPEKLDAAFNVLEETFTTLTAEAPTRAAGRTYAARTLVYEDCRRSTQVEVGSEIINELTQPLSLLLQSARWFTYEAAKVLRDELHRVYRELVTKNGGSRGVDGLSFWLQAQAQMFGNSVNDQNGLEAPVLSGLQGIFQQRWEDVLEMHDGQQQVKWRSSELRERTEKAFAAPHAGWSLGRYHSPDIMIATKDAESIRRGDYEFVMGELHLANNTLGASVFVEQHESPEELISFVESDMPNVRAIPMTPKEWLTARINYRFISSRDYRIEFTVNSFHGQRERAIPIAGLVVEESDDRLVARTRDGKLCFDMIELFGGMFSGFVVNQFKLVRELPHTPRITIDRLIVSRESWRFTAADVTFATIKDDADRYLAARRWANLHSLPRFVFVKAPLEPKPVYVDFDSPIFVHLLAKIIRRQAQEGSETATIAFSEMLPTFEQLWLPDAEDNRYTSELRIVALDLAEIGNAGK